jgi:hypothetical protein
MEPIQPGLPDPTKLRFRATDEDKQRFWMEPSVVFKEIFSKKEADMDVLDVNAQNTSVGMATLATLMGQPFIRVKDIVSVGISGWSGFCGWLRG